MNLEPVIGLEIHVQLKTKSKMFCACSNDSYLHQDSGRQAENQKPNTLICPVCTGHPGTLPVLNQEVVNYGIKLALALNLKINEKSVFERKSYFYPDLPTGYQISQFEHPLSTEGHYILKTHPSANSSPLKSKSATGPSEEKIRIGIERLHLENDAAKNIHQADNSLIDFNRSGTPLAEIVTKPDIKTPLQAKNFLQDLRKICRYLEISDADMEKGQLRCDVNISLRPQGDQGLYPKTEIKNLNSFKSVEKALEYEIKRQTELWNKNEAPKEETTRGWNDSQQITELQRSKEMANDYRYFPEPDIPTLIIKNKVIEKIKAEIPELPAQKIERFMKEYEMNIKDAEILTTDKKISEYFENVVSEFREWLISELESTSETENELWEHNKKKAIKLIISWITSELFKLMNEAGTTIEELKITPENMAEFIKTVYLSKVNSSNAQKILKTMFEGGGDPSQIIEEKDLGQVSEPGRIEKIVEQIIKNNPEQVEQYKAGKENLIKYFVGMLMKKTNGKANPQIGEELFREKLHPSPFKKR